MSLIGKPITSRITGMKGAIVDIDRKFLIVSFTMGGAKIPLAKSFELLEMSPETQNELEEYIASLKKPRKKAEDTNQ